MKPRVALIHDWLTGMRGGEKILEVFCELYPEADIFTLLHVPGSVSEIIEKHSINTSFLQHFPQIKKRYRHYLPFMPRAIESLDLKGYDLVLSSSHCVAKGCRPDSNAVHICCCFTPMRYIWDQYDNYFGPDSPWVNRTAMKLLRPSLQQWDVESSRRVTHFIAISQFVADRIKKYYKRDSDVIYPPADTDFYTLPQSRTNTADPYYLLVSALAPYKKIDLAVRAFSTGARKLKIVGTGQDAEKLRKLAGPNVEFLGWRNNDELRGLYQNCQALIFPGVEDYGIVPVEAMSCGKPVIAYRAGGVTETVSENVAGLFFERADETSLLDAVGRFEKQTWDSSKIRAHALKFSKTVFVSQMKQYLAKFQK